MRMPNSRQISEEQQDVFEEAPIDGNVLVTGPPGTGKTIIAFLRAQAIARRKSDVIVLMYNRVLRRYTENVAKQLEGSIESKTFHRWLPEWWRSHQIEQPSDEKELSQNHEQVYLITRFDEKDEVKALGAKWNKELKKWYVSSEEYDANRSLFSKWSVFKPKQEVTEYGDDFVYLNTHYDDRERVRALGARWHKGRKKWYITKNRLESMPESFAEWLGVDRLSPPEIKKWVYDWDTMLEQYLTLEEGKRNDWGYLIIDEAQDFNPAMFEFLRMVGRKLPKGGVTVLADENQRLEEGYNSSIDDIRANLRIKVDCEFKLTQNFRNTRPIAEVARFFYAGLQSGMPDLPERDGNKPQLITATDEFTQVKYIKNFLQFRGAQEVGVIVDSERDREFFAEQLKTALPNYHIQSYTSKEPLLSESLLFDSESQGVITILNRRSCKGLEFDTVFIPELQSFKFDDTNLATFQMNLYVMCSRARTELIIMKSNGINESAPVLKHFPTAESDLFEYREVN